MEFLSLFKDPLTSLGIPGLVIAYFIWENFKLKAELKDVRDGENTANNALQDKISNLQEKRIDESKSLLTVIQANTTSLDNLGAIVKDRRNGVS